MESLWEWVHLHELTITCVYQKRSLLYDSRNRFFTINASSFWKLGSVLYLDASFSLIKLLLYVNAFSIVSSSLVYPFDIVVHSIYWIGLFCFRLKIWFYSWTDHLRQLRFENSKASIQLFDREAIPSVILKDSHNQESLVSIAVLWPRVSFAK